LNTYIYAELKLFGKVSHKNRNQALMLKFSKSSVLSKFSKNPSRPRFTTFVVHIGLL
jgi:hypothetical protein